MGIIKNRKAYLAFLLPALLFYLFAVFYPIIQSIFLSFNKWRGLGPMIPVQLSNYLRMFTDSTFKQVFINNLIYLVIVVIMQLLIGLLLAVIVRNLSKGQNMIKTLYYVPCIITTVAVTQMFRSMYSTEPVGLFNQILNSVGLSQFSTSWIANVKTVLIAVSIPEGWRFTGLYMVIFFAALVSLDPQISEAAMIDGASKWKSFWHIEIPMIKPIIILSLTMCLTGGLRGFDIPFLLTAGGPGNKSELMATYMYKVAFSNNQFGYGSTLAVFIIFECIVAVFILRNINKLKKN